MNELIENASNLSRLFISRAQFKADIQATEDKIAACELTATPIDGWPGKNEGERLISKACAFMANPEWLQLNAMLRGFQGDLGKVLSEIDGINASTSAIEFTIRDETNRVMGGKSILDVLQDGEIEQASNDHYTEEEMTEIEAQYERDMQEQAEERQALEAQPKLDFEPGSVDDPNSDNYVPF